MILTPIVEEMNELQKKGKEPVVILMSRRTLNWLLDNFPITREMYERSERDGNCLSFLGVPVRVIEEISGHFIQVLEDYPFDSKYNELYPELERKVLKASKDR